jgi:adenylate kinase family enzyme
VDAFASPRLRSFPGGDSASPRSGIFRKVKRVVVTGPAGAGKSELARLLGERLGIPVLHLDALFWGPGWTPTPADEWEARQRAELAAESWVVDSQFDDMVPDWVEAADTVVFVDASPARCLWRVTRRRLRRDTSAGVPDATEPSPPHRALLKFARNQWRYRTRVRGELLAELERRRNGRRAVVVRRRADAQAFLDSPETAGGTF